MLASADVDVAIVCFAVEQFLEIGGGFVHFAHFSQQRIPRHANHAVIGPFLDGRIGFLLGLGKFFAGAIGVDDLRRRTRAPERGLRRPSGGRRRWPDRSDRSSGTTPARRSSSATRFATLGLVVVPLGGAVEDVLQKLGGFRGAILGFEDIDFVVANLNGVRLDGFGLVVGLASLREIALLAIDLRHPQIGLRIRRIVRDQLVINGQSGRVILRQHQILRQIALHFALVRGIGFEQLAQRTGRGI